MYIGKTDAEAEVPILWLPDEKKGVPGARDSEPGMSQQKAEQLPLKAAQL